MRFGAQPVVKHIARIDALTISLHLIETSPLSVSVSG
jgi:hypothetical protein